MLRSLHARCVGNELGEMGVVDGQPYGRSSGSSSMICARSSRACAPCFA